MHRVTPRMRELSKRILDHTSGQRAASNTSAAPASLAVSELRLPLANLMGGAGYRALLLRSLTLGGLEVPWLHTVSVNPDGTPQGMDELRAQVGAAAFAKGNVALTAIMLTLLVAFVGQTLTLHLIRDVWPGLSLTDADIGEKR